MDTDELLVYTPYTYHDVTWYFCNCFLILTYITYVLFIATHTLHYWLSSLPYTEAGKQLREIISEKDASVVFYYSPYLRTKQTLDLIKPYFNENEIISCLEEPRISEQQVSYWLIEYSMKYVVTHLLFDCKL